MRQATVSFTHGISYNGVWLKKAELREINGYDQEQLFEQQSLHAVARMRTLLRNVVDFGKKVDQKEKEHLLNSLAIGDFVTLVLELRKLTSGDILRCLITCPSCKQDMSADITTTQLLQKPEAAEPKSAYEAKVGDFTLRLRPVTGEDLDSTEESNISLTEQLARLCILDSTPTLPEKLDAQFLAEINTKLAELDPQADILLNLTCPNCGLKFQVPFYPEDFFLQEVDARRAQFEGEVHWLAFNYHWNENEILSLPLSKRRRYVDLINRTLSGETP
jgi:TusA-related sulfurtransferase